MSIQSIADRAMLVNLTIKQWSARVSDEKAAAEVTTAHNADASLGRFTKQLVSKGGLKRVQKAATAARQEHYKRTLPWSDDGSRILSNVGYFDYCKAMHGHEMEWDAALDELFSSYDQLRAEGLRRLNGLGNPDDYPTSQELRNKYAMGYNVVQIPAAFDFRVELGEDACRAINAQVEARAEATIQAAMRDMAERVKEAVAHMAERLRAYTKTADAKTEGTFRDSLVENIQELAALLPALNITGDPKLAAILADLNNLTQFTPAELRISQWKREQVADTAEEILEAVSEFLA